MYRGQKDSVGGRWGWEDRALNLKLRGLCTGGIGGMYANRGVARYEYGVSTPAHFVWGAKNTV